jgi:tripartite-type tricarboxylate transporter receptor subunit TctC
MREQHRRLTTITTTITRRGWLQHACQAAALGLSGATTAAPSAAAPDPVSDYPRRPITLWVPWAAGGATDLSLRVLAEAVGQRLGQRLVIENRGGAGGTLAMPILQQAAPDGYTLAQMPQTVFRMPWTHPVAWHPLRDTTPIVQVSGVTFGMVVPVSSPWRSVADVLAWARQHPGQLTLATNGIGTTPHIVMTEWLGRQALDFVHVPYKGVAEQMLAVASGQVMVGVGANGFAPYVDSARVRLLATLAARRSPRWKDVPTLHELGHGIVATSPYGIAGPRGLSAATVQVLHEAFKAAMHDAPHLAELAKYDQELAYLGPSDYAQAMQAAFDKEKEVVQRLGLGSGSGSGSALKPM